MGCSGKRGGPEWKKNRDAVRGQREIDSAQEGIPYALLEEVDRKLRSAKYRHKKKTGVAMTSAQANKAKADIFDRSAARHGVAVTEATPVDFDEAFPA
jgi:hypothetical protein